MQLHPPLFYTRTSRGMITRRGLKGKVRLIALLDNRWDRPRTSRQGRLLSRWAGGGMIARRVLKGKVRLIALLDNRWDRPRTCRQGMILVRWAGAWGLHRAKWLSRSKGWRTSRARRLFQRLGFAILWVRHARARMRA